MNSDQITLRLPDGMRDRIKAAAKVSGRTMNEEILYQLEVTMLADQKLAPRLSQLRAISLHKARAELGEQSPRTSRPTGAREIRL